MFPRFRSDTRKPSAEPPAPACDCHVHVLGDPAKYPYRQSWPFVPPETPPTDATFGALGAMHSALGISRAVLVQPGLYGTDHSLLIDTLRHARDCRGIAWIDETVDDRTLARLNDAGVRGLRFNFWRRMDEAPSPALFRRALSVAAEYGWHIKVQCVGEDWLEIEETVDHVHVPMVIDHLGHVDVSKGTDQPAFRFLLDLLKRDNVWILVGNGDRRSNLDAGWDDVLPFARAYVEAAPDRCIWASDWPHLGYRKRMPDDAELLELLYRFAPEPELQRKILVDNPARLFGFDL
jgi:predicted TIM-barrel fold metal-dependent hydrolase